MTRHGACAFREEIRAIGNLGRRELLQISAVLAASGTVAFAKPAGAETLPITPQQILGPFYPLTEFPQTSNLTRLPGRSGRAKGQVLNVMGRVMNIAGEPVRGAKVEVWQANASGGIHIRATPIRHHSIRTLTGQRC